MRITIQTADDGQDKVALNINGGDTDALLLTPSQARALATELITAVNRAEVKANLKVSPNLWRRPGEVQPRLLPAG